MNRRIIDIYFFGLIALSILFGQALERELAGFIILGFLILTAVPFTFLYLFSLRNIARKLSQYPIDKVKFAGIKRTKSALFLISKEHNIELDGIGVCSKRKQIDSLNDAEISHHSKIACLTIKYLLFIFPLSILLAWLSFV